MCRALARGTSGALPSPISKQAQDDATIVAIRDMENAGIDIITDGEVRRESYSNRFATALEGMDADNPARIERPGRPTVTLPRVVGPIKRPAAIERRDLEFLKRNTSRAAKITLPGPFTLAQLCKDEFYGDKEALTMAFAEVVNAEMRDLQAAGADVIQIDEPWLRNDPDGARRYAVKAINAALKGITTPTVLHLCFGYAQMVKDQKPREYPFLEQLSDAAVEQISIEAAQPDLDLTVLSRLSNKTIMLGVIDLGTPEIETAATVAGRVRAALKYVDAKRLVLAPDCGMKYLSRETAFGKLKVLSDGVAIVRKEVS